MAVCTDTFSSSELTRVLEHQLWSLCLGLCICVEESHILTVPIWNWANWFDTSPILRIFLSLSGFWFIFKNSPQRPFFIRNFPVLPGRRVFQPVIKEIQDFVWVYVWYQRTGTDTGPTLGLCNQKNSTNKTACLFSFPPSHPPSLPHCLHTLLKHMKSKRQNHSK